ncbi:MAG: hypothetical protein IJJ25_05125 [Lachnospiraceae bacterium]|nr:hypothetical protein [Lachnospiraceae bacterium]
MNIKRPEYGLSEKYLARLRKDTILNLLIIFMFWLVFNVLFKDHPKYGIIKVLFVFVFLAIAVAVTIMNAKRVRKAETIGFTLTKDALLYCDGKKTAAYPWHHFEKVTVNENRISMPFPYEFHTKEGMFLVHRQLDRPEKVLMEIIKRARPYAQIDEKIPEVIKEDDNWVKGLGRML